MSLRNDCFLSLLHSKLGLQLGCVKALIYLRKMFLIVLMGKNEFLVPKNVKIDICSIILSLERKIFKKIIKRDRRSLR